MALGSIFKIFMPKDKVFYTMFEGVSGNLKLMSEVFISALAEADRGKRDDLLRKLEDLEHKNDEITHQIFIELGQNFITPFDREDIHTLTTSLDDVADYLWGSAKRIINYQIEEIDDTMREFSVIIDKCIAALHRAVYELRDMKQIKDITDACVAINKLENDADDVFDKATVRLFSNPGISAVELVKRKDLYQELEIVTDKCEDAANVIESIIIKYA
jgi:predicted phosphate transport protein (TIGR00153 family)